MVVSVNRWNSQRRIRAVSLSSGCWLRMALLASIFHRVAEVGRVVVVGVAGE